MTDKNSHIVAIGGLPEESGCLALFRYLLSLTGKSRPAIGFVATASGDAPAALQRITALLGKFDCLPSVLPLFDRTPDLREYITAQDVILVGGGNTKSMLAVWREWNLVEILKLGWEEGRILAGWSAGAICWFEQGVTDSFADSLQPLDCLGFLPGSCCPHYTRETDRRPAYHELLRQKRIKPGIALDDEGAIHFRGSQPWRVIAPAGVLGVRTVCLNQGSVVEEPMPLERVELGA
jgi:peptidase E